MKIKIPFSTLLSNQETTLSLALDQPYVFVIKKQEGDSVTFEGIDVEYVSKIQKIFCDLTHKYNKEMSGIHICYNETFPLCNDVVVLCSMILYCEWHKIKVNKYELWKMMEGYIDCPHEMVSALFGSLCASYIGESYAMIRYLVQNDYRFCITLLQDEIKDKHIIDAKISQSKDALLAKAFEIGNSIILRKLYEEEIRDLLLSSKQEWITYAKEHSSIGTIFKSNVLIHIFEQAQDANQFQQKMREKGYLQCFVCNVNRCGYVVER